MNPLLDFSGLPRFADFKPELVTPAVDELLADNRALIERIAAPGVAATWHDFVEPLEDENERLGRAWGVVSHLNAVMNSPELREAYNSNLPKVTQYYTELSQHAGEVLVRRDLLRVPAAPTPLTRPRLTEHHRTRFPTITADADRRRSAHAPILGPDALRPRQPH